MYNGQNKYTKDKTFIERSQNSLDQQYIFRQLIKNLAHNYMMPPKGKSTKRLQRAGEEGVSQEGGGRVL